MDANGFHHSARSESRPVRNKQVSKVLNNAIVLSTIGQRSIDHSEQPEISDDNRLKSSSKTAYFQIIDTMAGELERRFVENEAIVAMDTLHPSNPTFIDITQILQLTEQYKCLGSNDLLKNEVVIAKEMLRKSDAKCTDDVIQQLLPL